MPKVNVNSRDNYSSMFGVVEQYSNTVSQPVLETSDVLFNKLVLTDSLIVGGNLTVNGSTTVISTETIEFQDNIIEINSGESGDGVSANLSGIQINRGSASPYQFVFQESSNLFKIGQEMDLQTVATRQEYPMSNGIMIFNNDTSLLEATNLIPIDITFNGSNSVGSSSGAVRISGGLGISNDIFIDGKIYFKGLGYGNHISGNVLNDLVLRSDNDFTINLSSGKNINIPSNVKLVLGDTSFIQNDTTDLVFGSGSNIVVEANAMVLSANLIFESGNLEYDTLSFIGNSLSLNSAVSISNTTASTSSSLGSLVVYGGVGISGELDSVSITNGGALTVAGGVSISKKLYVGGKVQIESDLILLENTRISKKLLVGIGSNSGSFVEPLCIDVMDFSYTDNITPVLGVVPDVKCNSIGTVTLSSSNLGVSVNSASTFYINGPPIAGMNITLLNTFSLNVNSGSSRFNGKVLITDVNDQALVVSGGVIVNKNITVSGGISIGSNLNASPGISGKFLNIPTSNINDIGSGISENMFFNRIASGTLTATGTVTTTNSATLVIDGPPVAQLNQTIINNYALWVKSGKTKVDDMISNTAFAISSIVDEYLQVNGEINLLGGFTAEGLIKANNILAGTTSGVSSSVIYESHGIAIVKETNSPFIGFSGFKTPMISSVDVFETTKAATLYIEGPPVASGSHIIADSFSLLVESGNSKFDGKVLLTDTTESTDTATGSLVVSGGVGVSGTTITQKLNTIGATTLNETLINTTTGKFQVSGGMGIGFNVESSSNFTVSNGDLLLSSVSGPVLVQGSLGVSLDTEGIISLTSNANSVWNTGTGNLTFSGANLLSNADGMIKYQAGGKIEIDTTSMENGIKIGTLYAGVPVIIGNNASETTIGSNLTVIGNLAVQGETTTLNSRLITTDNNAIIVNSMPSGLSDGGLLVRRYQTPNNTNNGQVVKDLGFETGVFETNSAGNILYLGTNALAVNEHYKGWWIKITSGAGVNQVRRIKSYSDTREATIYQDLDNSDSFVDGLDLTVQVLAGDTYNIYPGTFAGMFYDDTNDEWAIGRVPFEENSGRFPLYDYSALHVHSILLETGIVYSGESIGNGSLTLDNNSDKTLLVRKQGDSGDVFYIDTENPSMVISNPSNTAGTGPVVYLNAFDNFNVESNYAQISTNIENNTAGSLRASLDFNLVQGSIIQNYLSIDSNTGISNFTSKVSVSNSTSSTNPLSGSMVVAGGVGVSGNLFTGGDIGIESGTASVSTITGALRVSGGIGVSGTAYIGQVRVIDEIASTSTTSGALVVLGGVGVKGALNIEKDIIIGYQGDSVNALQFKRNDGVITAGINITGLDNNATLQIKNNNGKVDINAGVNGTFFSFDYTIGSSTVRDFKILSSTESTSSNTGAMVVSGGIGIGGRAFIGGNSHFTSTTSSSSISTGALLVSGGMGIAENLNVGNGVFASNIGIGTTSVANSITLIENSSIGLDSNSGKLTILGGISESEGAMMEIYGNISPSPGDLNLVAGTTGDINLKSSSLVRMSIQSNGQVNITTPTDSTDTLSGSLTTLGGASIGKKLYIGTELHVIGSSNLGQVTTGEWNATTVSVQYGGTGVETLATGSLLVGNGTSSISSPLNLTFVTNVLSTPQFVVTDATQASSSTTAPTSFLGGVAVSKNMFIGTNLFTGGNIGVGTSVNVNSELTMVKNSVIGLNTLGGSDDGFLSITGGGTANSSRGGFITLHGEESSGAGAIYISAGSVSGTINFTTAGTPRVQVAHSGTVSVITPTTSTSNGVGAVVLEGGLGIKDSTNSTSSINGGSITTAGGVAVAKDVYIGGNLRVTGSIIGDSSVSSPAIVISDLTNVSLASSANVKIINNNQEKTLSGIFLITATTASTKGSFEFTVPFANIFTTAYDIVPSVQGFTSDLSNIENITCFTISGTNRARISFTAFDMAEHVFQFIIRY